MQDDRIQSLRGKRELRQLRHRQQRGGVIAFIVLAAVLLVLVVEVGRAFGHMRRVNAFVSTLATQSPEQIKAGLDGFLDLLTDRNPLVRNAGVAAFTAATEMQSNASPADWRLWWLEHRATWQRGSTNGTDGTVSPQPYRQAFPSSR